MGVRERAFLADAASKGVALLALRAVDQYMAGLADWFETSVVDGADAPAELERARLRLVLHVGRGGIIALSLEDNEGSVLIGEMPGHVSFTRAIRFMRERIDALQKEGRLWQ